jgi:hypothetical protein
VKPINRRTVQRAKVLLRYNQFACAHHVNTCHGVDLYSRGFQGFKTRRHILCSLLTHEIFTKNTTNFCCKHDPLLVNKFLKLSDWWDAWQSYASLIFQCQISFLFLRLLLLLLFMPIEWDYVSEVRPPTGLLFVSQMYDYGPRWNDTDRVKPKNLGRKPVPVPRCPPQIPRELTPARTRAYAVRCHQRDAPRLPRWKLFSLPFFTTCRLGEAHCAYTLDTPMPNFQS